MRLWHTPGGGQAAIPGAVGAPRGRLDVALQQVQQGHSVGQPVGQAGIVVLLALDLHAHGIDDAVEQRGAVCLEGLPLQARPEDDQRCQRPPVVEAQVVCTQHMPID